MKVSSNPRTSAARISAIRTLLALAGGALVLGCVSSTSPQYDSHEGMLPEALRLQDIDYTVQPGDQLSMIAEELTGDLQQWQAISRYNNIDDPGSIYVGQVLLIPFDLLRPELRSQHEARTVHAIQLSQADESSIEAVAESRTELGDPEIRSVLGSGSEVSVGAVNVNRRFEVQRIDPADLQPLGEQQPGWRRIRVVGSYYPKGVYSEPAFGSRLLLRATPGTEFEVERLSEEWIRIRTDKGVGYIPQIDAELVENAPRS